MGGTTPQQHSAVDQLVAAAVASDPQLERIKHRLRPRLQTLLSANQNTLLCWGEENLAVTQRESVVHARLAQRVSQLSVAEWLHKCAEASTAPPGGWTAMFRRPEGPQFYEAKLRQLQAEMGPMLTEYARLVEDVRPELEDIRLDAAALAAVAPRHQDPTMAMIISNRLRTLVTGQQTAAQLLQSAENARMTLAQHCQNMDQLLSVTLPAWRIAEASR